MKHKELFFIVGTVALVAIVALVTVMTNSGTRNSSFLTVETVGEAISIAPPIPGDRLTPSISINTNPYDPLDACLNIVDGIANIFDVIGRLCGPSQEGSTPPVTLSPSCQELADQIRVCETRKRWRDEARCRCQALPSCDSLQARYNTCMENSQGKNPTTTVEHCEQAFGNPLRQCRSAVRDCELDLQGSQYGFDTVCGGDQGLQNLWAQFQDQCSHLCAATQ